MQAEKRRHGAGIDVRPLTATDLDEAGGISRVAFGTFLGGPEPERLFGGADTVRTRREANPAGALAAVCDGKLVGSDFAHQLGIGGVLRSADRRAGVLVQGHRASG